MRLTPDTETPTCLVNLRDVATASTRLREGLLYRSDAPHSTDAHPAGYRAWPPATVIDLRDDAEKIEEHPFTATSTILNLPLLTGANLPRSLADLYRGMLDSPAADRLVVAAEAIAAGPGPVLVHCTAGKDRTGVTIAITLALVGVAHSEIVADYTRTDSKMPLVLARMPLTTAARPRADAETDADSVIAMRDLLGAPRDAMDAFLAALDDRGGAVRWLQNAGGDPGIIDRLRERLLN